LRRYADKRDGARLEQSVDRELGNRVLHQGISIHDPEPWQREAFRRVVLVNDFNLLPNVVDILRQAVADKRGGHKRPFVELDQSVAVRNLVLEARMEGHVMTVKGEDFSAPARFRPVHVGGKRLVLVILAEGLGPVASAAFLATPEQEFVLL